MKSLQVKIQNTKNYKTYSRGTHNFGLEETTIRLLSYFIVWLVLHEKDNKWGHSILDQSSTLSEFSCPTSPMLDSSIVRKNSSHVTYILYLYTHKHVNTSRLGLWVNHSIPTSIMLNPGPYIFLLHVLTYIYSDLLKVLRKTYFRKIKFYVEIVKFKKLIKLLHCYWLKVIKNW